ncbi:hypothetical protein [Paraburkholderia tagetis]|uniref:Uncharacterized protein n=1 Tax=Paraburkholderia tagetis TaxID=2913261 RepID=A0A9X1UPF2_9BURK|nr:hypothetical protein [Paraburkholderia tagetis]MCG5079063.1 hypothetical protein [Paraburkholderia tagetis]
MRIVVLWQLLLPLTAGILDVKISTGQADRYADFVVLFANIPSTVLGTIVDRLGCMTWVTSATMTPA